LTAEPDHGSDGSEGNEGKETDEQPAGAEPINVAKSMNLAFNAKLPKYGLILYAVIANSQDKLASFLDCAGFRPGAKKPGRRCIASRSTVAAMRDRGRFSNTIHKRDPRRNLAR
jgi:hypothetical protein